MPEHDLTLPLGMYMKHPETGETILIKRGVSGYFPVQSELTVDQLNQKHCPNLTNAQKQAMEIGSMFGWHLPGAHAKTYE